MPNRGLFLLFLLGGAFIPYMLSGKSSVRDALSTPLKALSGEETPAAPATIHAAAAPTGAVHGTGFHGIAGHGVAAVPHGRTAAKEHFINLDQAFRWEITPAWILGNWARVTTDLAELESQGYRVTLVTGTTQTDIAGSLTYYFDAKQVLQKIVFNGTTGDAKTLVQFLLAKHHFERRLTDDPSLYLYQVEQDSQALSDLKIRTASIVRTENAYSRFEVSLTMRRPEE